ncbi:MAG TPA: CHRD domain-containing protein [Trueperaceae bacterium]
MRRSLSLLLIGTLALLVSACSPGVTPGAVEPNAISYALDPVAASGVDGIVTFEKMSDTETLVTIEVEGLDPGQTYPAHIHTGNYPDGPVYIPLTPVSGDTGTSVTMVTTDPNGVAVDYEFLVNYDGFVNVHAPAGSPILATGETGAGGNDVQVDL